MADWNAIKTEYITTTISYRALAEKYGLSRNTVGERGKAEQWPELRRQHRDKTLSKTLSLVEKKQARKMARIDSITDQLLQKLEKAVEELDLSIVTEKVKTADGSSEKTTERRYAEKGGIVDRAGLKQIASALKDIKEVQMLRSELDRQEQEARIANLRKQAQKEGEDGQGVQVLMGDGLEEFAQ